MKTKLFSSLVVLILLNFSQVGAKNPNTLKINSSNTNQQEFSEVIKKELKFKGQSNKNLLMVGNVTGEISIQGYNGSTVQIEILRSVNGISDNDLQKGIEETKIKFIEANNRIYVYMDSPYSKLDLNKDGYSYNRVCQGNCPYNFNLRYNIKVPFNTNIKVNNVNGGNINIKDMKGQYIETNHITGSINLSNIQGETRAKTITGSITASYTKNPDRSSSFITTTGSIKLSFLKDLNATLKYDIFDGRFISEFSQNKSRSYSGKQKQHSIKIGSGGSVQYFMKTTTGSIGIKKNTL